MVPAFTGAGAAQSAPTTSTNPRSFRISASLVSPGDATPAAPSRARRRRARSLTCRAVGVAWLVHDETAHRLSGGERGHWRQGRCADTPDANAVTGPVSTRRIRSHG